MKAVISKDGTLSLISREESRVFNKIDFDRFCDISKLSERECFIAEELYKKNILRKVRSETKVGYKIYPQQKKI